MSDDRFRHKDSQYFDRVQVVQSGQWEAFKHDSAVDICKVDACSEGFGYRELCGSSASI